MSELVGNFLMHDLGQNVIRHAGGCSRRLRRRPNPSPRVISIGHVNLHNLHVPVILFLVALRIRVGEVNSHSQEGMCGYRIFMDVTVYTIYTGKSGILGSVIT
jgi:hypothetical protein